MARTTHGPSDCHNSAGTEGVQQDPVQTYVANTLFITCDINKFMNLDQGGRILLNEYLGRALKEYIQLLIKIL